MPAPIDYRMMARDTNSGVSIYLSHPDCVCKPFVLSVFVEDIELRKEEFYCVNTGEAIEKFHDTHREFRQAGLMGRPVTDLVKGIKQ